MRLSETVGAEWGDMEVSRIPGPLISSPFRLALLEKRRDAFAEVSRGADRGVLRDGIGKLAVEIFPDEAVDESFGCPHGSWTVFLQGSGKFAGARHQLRGFDDFVDEAESAPFGSVENPARDKQVASNLVPHLPDQDRRNQSRKEADADFRIAELRFRSRQSKVAHGSQASSPGDGRSVDRGDGGLGEVIEPTKHLGDTLGVGQILSLCFAEQRLQFFKIK